MKCKKLLSAALAVCMTFGSAAMLPEGTFTQNTNITASAESKATSGKCGENVNWSLKGGVLTISGTGKMTDYDYGDNISPFYNRKDIKSVVIKSGVTSIGNYAFYSCKSLSSITIPSSVTSIGLGAFSGSGLTSITIPNSVTSIGDYAFVDCEKLTSITIPKSVTSIGLGAFSGSGLTSVTIQKGVTSIGDVAFSSCTNLSSVTIPNSVKSIGMGAFSETKWLENQQKKNPLVIVNGILIDGTKCSGKVTVPSSVKSIGDDAFSYCSNLSSITIPTSVTSIGKRAFRGCGKLKSITIPNSVKNIGKGAFEDCTSLTSITIPNSVKSIGDEAFSFCMSLTSVTIPSSVTSIGDYAFSGSGLKSITIPNSVTSIGERTFEYCTNLTSINIPSSVTSIGVDAFSETKWFENQQKKNPLVVMNGILIDGKKCSGKVTIPNSVKSIGDSAFARCEKLTSITIPNSVTSIGKDAFWDCTNLSSVNIPSSVTSIGGYAFSETKWLENQQKKNPLVVVNGILIDGTKCKGKVTIPNSIKVIVDAAFAGCEKLTSVTIPSSVKSIGDTEFYGCTSLTSVTIPDSVTSVGSESFCNCTSLRTITIPKSVSTIGNNAFGFTRNEEFSGNFTLYDKVEEFKINCYKDTAGEQYAKDNKFDYELLDIEHVEAKNATCTEEGNIEYWTWNGKFYSDDKATNEIAEEGTVIPKTEHPFGEWITVSFDTSTGTSVQQRTCSVCGVTEKQTVKDAITRLAGSNRFLTAVEISKASFDKADTVILAFGLNYADALAGVPLATKLNAPILLTAKDTLPDVTLAEINRLGAKKVIILGGTGAISEKVEKTLKTNKLKTERIAGKTRFGTATAIAEKLNQKPTDVFFVYSLNYADALSVGGIAAAKNAPIIYLTTKGELNADTAAYLAKIKGSVKNAYVIGGTGVISNDMSSKAAKALGLKRATRVAGSTRFLTCVAVNEKFADVLDGDMLCVATGMDFPDALAGGVYAAKNKAPLFLINGLAKSPNLLDEQKAYLKAKSADSITTFGGTNAVPDEHITDIAKNSI